MALVGGMQPPGGNDDDARGSASTRRMTRHTHCSPWILVSPRQSADASGNQPTRKTLLTPASPHALISSSLHRRSPSIAATSRKTNHIYLEPFTVRAHYGRPQGPLPIRCPR